MINSLELYSDGSALRNPGPAGYGYIIKYWEDNGTDIPEIKTIEHSQGYRLSSNNRMEIMGTLEGMKSVLDNIDKGVLKNISQVNIFSDSAYVVDCINKNWIGKWVTNNWMTSGFQGKQPKPVSNKDLWERMIEIRQEYQNRGIINTFNKVKGHDGNELNERADKLATDASNGTNFIIDEEYEKIINGRR